MKMVTSQTRDRDKEEVLNAFYAFVLNIADGLRPSSALSWRNMAVGMTSSQLTVKQCGTSCSRWTLINLWGLVDSPESTQRAGWCHHKASLDDFWAVLGIQRGSSWWEVVLVFKKGEKDDPRNYKPVSLTSVSGKLMEKIILGDIEKHLKDNAVISRS